MYTPVDDLCFSLEPLLEYVCVRKKTLFGGF